MTRAALFLGGKLEHYMPYIVGDDGAVDGKACENG